MGLSLNSNVKYEMRTERMTSAMQSQLWHAYTDKRTHTHLHLGEFETAERLREMIASQLRSKSYVHASTFSARERHSAACQFNLLHA